MAIVDRELTTAAGFARWYEAVVESVMRRVCAQVGDPLLGREATAEAFARAYERWARVATMESPEGWVYRVAVNVCRRSWRHAALESRALARLVPTAVGAPDDRRDDVYQALRRLPQRQRTALRLRYWDDLTEREIAERMDIAPGTASALLSTARTRLRRVLAADPAGAGGER